MHVPTLFDLIPPWALFPVMVLLVLLLVESGFRLGRSRRARSDHEMEAPVGAMVGAALGLLAFMLAFTFGNAASRHDTRRQLVVEEANAIRTTYLWASMLPDRGAEIEDLLRSYLDLRLEIARTRAVEAGVLRSEAIQDELWAEAAQVARAAPDSIVVGLFVQSLNQLIDVHATRIAFSTVLLLIADLDRPQEGTLKVSQQSLLDLQRTMGLPLP